ncbi:MAG: zinc ribbon domain-containing protein [Acidobacteria bacterium]|nr:zinc ribbon domain-containing protein [Acidobacteriota bacterium]
MDAGRGEAAGRGRRSGHGPRDGLRLRADDGEQHRRAGRRRRAPQVSQKAATVECPNCKEQVQAGAKFCANCGQSVEPKKCKQCEQPLAPGAKFCAGCGTPTTEESKP